MSLLLWITEMTWVNWLVVVICSLIFIGILCAGIAYYIVHTKKNLLIGKNRFLVLDNDQTLTKKDVEKVLKEFSHKYKECGYTSNEFEVMTKTRGHYTFMFGVNSDVSGFSVDKVNEEFNKLGIKSQVYSYREYHKKYDKAKTINFNVTYGTEHIKSSKTKTTKKSKK